MRTRRRRIRSRAYAASVLAALAAAIAGPTAALAVPADTQYPRPVPQTRHLTPSDFANTVGDTPADFGRSVAPVAKRGDTPPYSPGATRAQASSAVPAYSTVMVWRPPPAVTDSSAAPSSRATHEPGTPERTRRTRPVGVSAAVGASTSTP